LGGAWGIGGGARGEVVWRAVGGGRGGWGERRKGRGCGGVGEQWDAVAVLAGWGGGSLWVQADRQACNMKRTSSSEKANDQDHARQNGLEQTAERPREASALWACRPRQPRLRQKL